MKTTTHKLSRGFRLRRLLPVMPLVVFLTGCATPMPISTDKRPIVYNRYSLIDLNFAPTISAQVRLGGSHADPFIDVENKLGENAIQLKELPIDYKPTTPTNVKVTT